ncbi:unnamed protein product [Tilletia controversa]|uniref:nicotinamidase n=3 Tax=Tilletia TaxID=13289 RepID=A0A8X7SXH7_9BASI|nr:hypothetical protein CF336_g3067 [Tilletia laevis]KAE8206056.1 hypothetical protein CF328_g134 [Tilletia controversa]KAE8262221.1 hypothetical protein A4X03_0g2629 [Tilletia caries]KAE8205084.1 hypothetical protein CF335_g2429 [Tilletia laevis]KAE8248417.1 hypothetical protein A4X06_0g3736 [Tilletia controversa]
MAIGLLLIDIQNDFIDGSLAVNDAQAILPTVYKLVDDYPLDLIVVSQDWHPPTHISFASSHKDETRKTFTTFDLVHPLQPAQPIKQELWPVHCVQGTRGADIEAGLAQRLEAVSPGCLKGASSSEFNGDDEPEGSGQKQVVLIQKGTEANADGYSAFSLNGYLGFTSLPRTLFSWTAAKPLSSSSRSSSTQQTDKIDTLILCGLATDYCCLRTAIDARKFGFRTIVVEDGVRGVGNDTVNAAWEEMERWGCERVKTAEEAWQAAARQP